jgi:hypothetical protein
MVEIEVVALVVHLLAVIGVFIGDLAVILRFGLLVHVGRSVLLLVVEVGEIVLDLTH